MSGLAEVVGKNIVIKIPIKVLEHESVMPRECLDEKLRPRFKVVDSKVLAEDIVYELNREEDNGDTRLHLLMDDCFNAAIENGSSGVAELTYKDKK